MRERKLKGFSHIHSICGKYAALKFCRGVHKGTPSSHVSFSFLPCTGDLGSKGRKVRVHLLQATSVFLQKNEQRLRIYHSASHRWHRPKLKQRFFLYSHRLQVNVSSLPSWRVQVYQPWMRKSVQPRSKTSISKVTCKYISSLIQKKNLEDLIGFHSPSSLFIKEQLNFFYEDITNLIESLNNYMSSVKKQSRENEGIVRHPFASPHFTDQSPVSPKKGAVILLYISSNLQPYLFRKNSWLRIALLITPNHWVVLLMRGWVWSSSPIINITHYSELGQRWAQFVYLISN